MLKTIFLLGIVFAIGVALSIFVFPGVSVVEEIQNIPAHLQNIQMWISQQSIQVLASIGGAIGGVFTSIGLLWSRLTQAKQEVQEVKAMANTTKLYASQQIQSLNSTVDEQKSTITSQAGQIESLKTQLANAPNQEEIERLEKQIQNLNNEREAVARAVNIANQPTDADLIKRLTKAGYTVTKTVE